MNRQQRRVGGQPAAINALCRVAVGGARRSGLDVDRTGAGQWLSDLTKVNISVPVRGSAVYFVFHSGALAHLAAAGVMTSPDEQTDPSG